MDQQHPVEPATSEIAASGSSGLYRELGHITRQLHDSLGQLGVMPRLQQAAQGLPDARSWLHYVVDKTSEAAHRVLTAVESAKGGHRALAAHSEELKRLLRQPGLTAVPAAAVAAYVQQVEAHSIAIDHHLTDIMMAQDFHDLTGQVVRRILELANTLEDSLVHLLVQAAPEEMQPLTDRLPNDQLQGPVVVGTEQGDVVTNQGEVDDLLASLGF